MKHRVVIALGANIGNREQELKAALAALTERGMTLGECSRFYETSPVGFVSSKSFLNATAVFFSDLEPMELLLLTQDVEQKLGRTTKSTDGTYHDRPIDIDILAIDDIVVDTPELTLPHPRMHERRFVLEPLCEIFPEFIHPTLHLSAKDLLRGLNTLRITEVTAAEPSVVDSLNVLMRQLSQRFNGLSIADVERTIAHEQTHLIVGLDETGAVVATCCLCLASSLTGDKAWLEDLVVDETARGRGYAKQLLHHAIAIAKSLGAKSLYLTSRPERKAANALYKKVGFEPRETNVYRMVF
ncbi:MAG: 2-amino-4-hydroxy-6-hydroxymethyldihydropteridine diphosphokinase [Prevotella sp.]|nr:2-amino-4-hydroxy-6-hydroxymethyldihydropteridine diphosphokinase [Prevotella sp.]